MSPISIEPREKWSELPLLQWPAVMTDEDVDAWGDILYMRGLVDELIDTLDAAFTDHTFDTEATLAELIGAPSIEYDVDRYLEPWPHDRAADMLAAWRNQTLTGSTQLAIENAGIPA